MKQPAKHPGWAITRCSAAMTSASSAGRERGSNDCKRCGSEEQEKEETKHFPCLQERPMVSPPLGPRQLVVESYMLSHSSLWHVSRSAELPSFPSFTVDLFLVCTPTLARLGLQMQQGLVQENYFPHCNF